MDASTPLRNVGDDDYESPFPVFVCLQEGLDTCIFKNFSITF